MGGGGGRRVESLSVCLSFCASRSAAGPAEAQKVGKVHISCFFTKSSDIGMRKREKCENFDFSVIFIKNALFAFLLPKTIKKRSQKTNKIHVAGGVCVCGGREISPNSKSAR